MKNLASSAPTETADGRLHEPAAGSGNTPGRSEELARRPDLSAPLDTSNEFSVCLRGDGMVGIYGLPAKHLRRDQALRLAVWIVGEIDPERKDFDRMLQEILK